MTPEEQEHLDVLERSLRGAASTLDRAVQHLDEIRGTICEDCKVKLNVIDEDIPSPYDKFRQLLEEVGAPALTGWISALRP